jgi:hypothetical protein
MPTTNGNKPLLDLMRWETCASLPQSSSSNGNCFGKVDDPNNLVMYINGSTQANLYWPNSDGWTRVGSPALASSGAGQSIAGHMLGPTGTCPSNGTSTTIVTAQALRASLRGYKIHITGGPAAGDIRTIDSNVTTGSNCSVTVTSAFSASPTTATTYRIMSPTFYAIYTGSTSLSSFRSYDLATDTWTTRANNPVTNFGESALVSAGAFRWNDFVSFATGTATAATANTISNSAKAWTTNQWTNQQVRITGGTGAGQVRTISSNTGTQLTVSANWTTTPDTSSTYSIEGNDDHIYLLSSQGLYRYTISTNTFSAALAARGQTVGNGLGLVWPFECTKGWDNENAIKNGRYLVSPRGASSVNVDIYDIALNTWETGITFVGAAGMNHSTGVCWTYSGNSMYGVGGLFNTAFKFDIPDRIAYGWGQPPIVAGALEGQKTFVASYRDGATRIDWLYFNPHSTASLFRKMDI